jgi:ribosomal protein S21
MLIIPIKNNELERALKNFKHKVVKTQLIKNLQERKYHKKKSDTKRQILKNAIYKNLKNNEL